MSAVDLALKINRKTWLPAVDKFLQNNSWDSTWALMMSLIDPYLENSQLMTQMASLEARKALLNV